jgi:membrane-bound lytic murein transglycosylase A
MKIVMRHNTLRAVLLILFLLPPSCAQMRPGDEGRSAAAPARAPFPPESPQDFLGGLTPRAQGLDSWRGLETPLANSLRYVRAKNPSKNATARPGLSVTWGRLAESLERLLALLPELDADPGLLERRFTWVRIGEGIMYTGYYEPVIAASRTRKPGFSRPIYAVPPDLAAYGKRGRKYHDRAAIDKGGALGGKGLEMAWMDPVDAFFLQIQGSGLLRFEDGAERRVNYAARNGHKYAAVGRIMREEGMLEENNVNMPAIRDWLKNNPARRDEMLFRDPSYVFFRWGTKPEGAMGFPVRPWVSLAVDRSLIPLGAVVAYGVNLPDPDRDGTAAPLRGIGLAQDTGGAIKGARIDIFCGSGPRAAHIAGHLDARGEAWLLLAK